MTQHKRYIYKNVPYNEYIAIVTYNPNLIKNTLHT